MTLFLWNNKFSIGVTSIDEQHRKLFELINSLHSLMKSATTGIELNRRIDALIDYTNYHFNEEEIYMKQVGYIRFDQHKLAHENLRTHVLEFRDRIFAGEEVMDKFLIFLYDWLTKHIMEQDRKIGKFVEQKAIGPAK